MSHKLISIAIALSLLFGAQSCSNSNASEWKVLSAAVGLANQIFVVADQEVWDGPVGDTIRFYYGSPYILLPQPESIFDLKHFTPTDLSLEPVRKELRTYLIVADLEDEDSPTARMVKADLGDEQLIRAKSDPGFTTLVGKDRWAKGQLLVYQFSLGEGALLKNVIKNFPTVRKRINQFDSRQIEANSYQSGEQVKVMREVEEKFSVKLRIPNDYVVALEDSSFLWLKKDNRRITSNIMISRVHYKDTSQLKKKALVKLRNELGAQYITSNVAGSYMVINDVDLPTFAEVVDVNGSYALELRGIWEMVADFMGGSFISYMLYNPDKQDLLFLDGFLYAPGEYNKRNYMQNLELILNTAEY